MNKLQNIINITYTNRELNNQLKELNIDHEQVFTSHYNQSEEFFIKLEKEFTVPHFPIHHDVRIKTPPKDYYSSLTELIKTLSNLLPSIFKNLSYFFDPTEISKPGFFQLYKIGEQRYLYIIRIDLVYRVHESSILTRGDNDITAEYTTNNLFLESDFIPIDDIVKENDNITGFAVKQLISQTWIGETGRGHLLQGIWMDNELSKFFSKLLIPKGKKTYPYYPFTCKYKTLCHSIIQFSPEERKQHLPRLHKAMQFLAPRIDPIQNSLRKDIFSEDLETFMTIKKIVPEYWNNVWDSFKKEVYLNSQNMKEYLVEF